MDYIKELNTHFYYISDNMQYGTPEAWKDFSTYKKNERWKGDCEDYVCYLWKNIDGDIWICKLNGQGHAIFKLSNGDWIDCNIKKPVNTLPKYYTNFIKVPDDVVLARLEQGKPFVPIKPKGFNIFRNWLTTLIFKIKLFIKSI